jgi:hypothetical protein
MSQAPQTYVREEYVVIPPRNPISVDNHLEVMASRIIDVTDDGRVVTPQLAGLQATQATFMGLGLLVGAIGMAVTAGLAFRSYGRRKSALMPAVITGVGSLAMGGLILALSHLSNDARVNYVNAGLLLR